MNWRTSWRLDRWSSACQLCRGAFCWSSLLPCTLSLSSLSSNLCRAKADRFPAAAEEEEEAALPSFPHRRFLRASLHAPWNRKPWLASLCILERENPNLNRYRESERGRDSGWVYREWFKFFFFFFTESWNLQRKGEEDQRKYGNALEESVKNCWGWKCWGRVLWKLPQL